MIDELKNRYGSKCSGINVNGDVSKINIPSKKMKFCEAVHYSFKIPIQLNTENLQCPGARRSIGFDRDDRELANFISGNTQIPVPFVSDALRNIPTLNHGIVQINVGITQEIEELLPPDVFILYIHPSKITEIMHLFARYEKKPSIPAYSLLSVCGNVFTNCYINRQVSISFGCSESRKYGGVEDDEVIVGIPSQYAKHMLC